MAKRSARRAKTKRRARTHNQQQPSVALLGVAFDHFNRELFGGILKCPILKVKSLKSSLGRFSFDGCRNTTEDTICIDIHHFKQHSQAQVLSTLVHEMCHQWQSNHGKMGRRSGYHNLQWAAKMEECGLMASTTGKPGGKKNGPRVSHYIIPGGVFEQSCSRLPSDFVLYQPPLPVPRKHKSRVKPPIQSTTKPKVKPDAKATTKSKAVTKTAGSPPAKPPSTVAQVPPRLPRKRRPNKKLPPKQKSSWVMGRIVQAILDQPVLAILIAIAFLLVVV